MPERVFLTSHATFSSNDIRDPSGCFIIILLPFKSIHDPFPSYISNVLNVYLYFNTVDNIVNNSSGGTLLVLVRKKVKDVLSGA